MSDLSLYEKHTVSKKRLPVYIGLHKGKCRLHWHDSIEFLLFESDKNRVFCSEQLYDADEGDLIFIGSGCLHRNFGGRYYCIHLQKAFFDYIEPEKIHISAHIKKDPEIIKLVRQMWELYQSELVIDYISMKACAYRLIGYLLEKYPSEAPAYTNKIVRTGKTTRISEILLYISRHYNEKITTSTLSKHFFLSESYTCALFQRHLDMSPVEYIARLRVEKAAAFLKSSENSITEIALFVGYDDPGYFARVFKKYVGVSPGKYRKSPYDIEWSDL